MRNVPRLPGMRVVRATYTIVLCVTLRAMGVDVLGRPAAGADSPNIEFPM